MYFRGKYKKQRRKKGIIIMQMMRNLRFISLCTQQFIEFYALLRYYCSLLLHFVHFLCVRRSLYVRVVYILHSMGHDVHARAFFKLQVWLVSFSQKERMFEMFMNKLSGELFFYYYGNYGVMKEWGGKIIDGEWKFLRLKKD